MPTGRLIQEMHQPCLTQQGASAAAAGAVSLHRQRSMSTCMFRRRLEGLLGLSFSVWRAAS